MADPIQKANLSASIVEAYERTIGSAVVDSINHLYFGGFYQNPLEQMELGVDAMQAIAGVPQHYSLGAGQAKYAGATLAGTKLYTVPFNATQILEYDAVTRAATLFGSLSGTNKWMGGACASNNRIFLAPFDSTTALEINPTTRTVTTFGSFAGSGKWSGAVNALNDNIYCIPHNETRVLRIIPSTRATSFITIPNVPNALGKWRGGVVSPLTDQVIGVPQGTNRLLLITPTAGTAVLGIELAPQGVTFSGAVCGSNGSIYFIPNNATTIYVYNPVTQVVTTFGRLPEGENKWMGGSLAPNGKIYCYPHNHDSILEIDVANQAVRLIGKFDGVGKWAGGCLTPLGNVVGVPYNEESIISILGTGMAGTNWWALCSHANVF